MSPNEPSLPCLPLVSRRPTFRIGGVAALPAPLPPPAGSRLRRLQAAGPPSGRVGLLDSDHIRLAVQHRWWHPCGNCHRRHCWCSPPVSHPPPLHRLTNYQSTNHQSTNHQSTNPPIHHPRYRTPLRPHLRRLVRRPRPHATHPDGRGREVDGDCLPARHPALRYLPAPRSLALWLRHLLLLFWLPYCRYAYSFGGRSAFHRL